MMRELVKRLDKLIESYKLPWQRKGYAVDVALNRGARGQKVKLSIQDGNYMFSSVVLRHESMANKNERIELAYRVLRRNALKELVGFTFDEDKNLVGFITQPAEYLDDEELLLYLTTVAQECDRFEYKLTGKDVE